MDLSPLMAKVYELLTVYGLKVVAAVVIFVVGRWVAKAGTNFIKKMMTKGKVDETLVRFVGNLSYVALLAFVIIAALNQLGIQKASFYVILICGMSAIMIRRKRFQIISLNCSVMRQSLGFRN